MGQREHAKIVRSGQIVWVDFDPVQGREQAGRRPALVVSSTGHLRAATTLVAVLPCTTKDRGWSNHVQLVGETGLGVPTFAMTEQPRTLARSRVSGIAGQVNDDCLSEVLGWVHHWIEPERTSTDG